MTTDSVDKSKPLPDSRALDATVFKLIDVAMIRAGTFAAAFLIAFATRYRHRLVALVEQSDCQTAAVDSNGWIYYSEAFVRGLTRGQVATVTAHEMLHDMGNHDARRGDREHKLWNLCCDAVINHALEQAGFEPIPNWITLPPGYSGPLTPEALYAWANAGQPKPQGRQPGQAGHSGPPAPGLGCGPVSVPQGHTPKGAPAQPQPKAQPSQAQQGQGQQSPAQQSGQQSGQQGSPGSGSGSQTPGQPGQGSGQGTGPGAPSNATGQASQASQAGQGQQSRQAAADMMVAAARLTAPMPGAGSVPWAAVVQRAPARTKWERLLRHGAELAESSKEPEEETWNKINRRTLDMGDGSTVIMPGHVGTDPSLAVIIDASGSMQRPWLFQIVAEIKKIMASKPRLRVYVVTHTDGVVWQGWVSQATQAKDLTAAISYDGGTSVSAAYKAVEAESVRKLRRPFDVVIHFTDLGVADWPRGPLLRIRKLLIGAFGYAADNPGMFNSYGPGWTPPAKSKIIPISSPGFN